MKTLANPIVRFFFLSLLISFQTQAAPLTRPLPNWVDETRETKHTLSVTDFRYTPPPVNPFVVPPEYAPMKAVAMGWAGYSQLLTQIAIAVSTAGNAEVWMAGGPSALPNVSADKYHTIACPVDSVWMRDYGPFGFSSLTDRSQDFARLDNQLGIIDTRYRHEAYRINDDRLPTCLAELNGAERVAPNFILDGGNFMIDSAGSVFMTRRVLNWNQHLTESQVTQTVKAYFGAKQVHLLEYAGYPGSPADGTGHIDMFAKLLDDETVAIATSVVEPFKSNGENAIRYFSSLTTPSGRPYQIVELRSAYNGQTWFTYTNSLIVNHALLLPTYQNYKNLNDEAIKTLSSRTSYQVIGINSDVSIGAGGAIHCVTQQIPQQ